MQNRTTFVLDLLRGTHFLEDNPLDLSGYLCHYYTMSRKYTKSCSRVFDWDKAATILTEVRPANAWAGLKEDFSMTSRLILYDKTIVDKNREGEIGYLASWWATPVLVYKIDEKQIEVECYIDSEDTEWTAETIWPQSARKILDPFFFTQLYNTL